MITENLNKIELYINNDWIDTLVLSRLLLSHVKNYKLKSLVEELELEWDYSYRTIDAARLVAKMYLIYVATAYVDYVRKSVTKYILFVRKSVDK